MLFEDIVPLRYYAGNFRGDDPRYPCLRGNAKIGGKFGLHFTEVAEKMRSFGSELIQQDGNLNAFLKAQKDEDLCTLGKIAMVAGATGELIKIHPFRNGNGRISRLLANHLCHRYDLPMPFVDPSTRPSDNMYQTAGSTAMDGDYRPLAQYIFAAIKGRITQI
jgi:fido (protein-threonine AMPylation protein)